MDKKAFCSRNFKSLYSNVSLDSTPKLENQTTFNNRNSESKDKSSIRTNRNHN